MIIWNEELIPKLCDEHLSKMWQDGHTLLNHIVDDDKKFRLDPHFIEFKGCPLVLIYRLHLIYKEARKRKYELDAPPSPYLVTDNVLEDGWKQIRLHSPYQTIEQQINILKKEGCECNI